MPVEYGYPAYPVIEYDGTNSAEVIDAVSALKVDHTWAVTAESPEEITIYGTPIIPDYYTPLEYTVPVGYRLGYDSGHVLSPAEWAEKWVKVS